MKRRDGITAARTDKPALVSSPVPLPADAGVAGGVAADGVAGGVVSSDVPTTPAVPSTEPLPSDQATAIKVPIVGGAVAPDPARNHAAVERPSIVPEHVPAADLVPPAEPVSTSDVAMARVPSTVPLPADQITPVAPVAPVAPVDSRLSDEDIARLRDAIMSRASGDRARAMSGRAVDDDDFDGLRLFPVAYDVDHDGRSYTPGGIPVPLTFPEYQRLHRATAVTIAWEKGEVPVA